jgi:hypothetical protein
VLADCEALHVLDVLKTGFRADGAAAQRMVNAALATGELLTVRSRLETAGLLEAAGPSWRIPAG